jgi:hypothetical protein
MFVICDLIFRQFNLAILYYICWDIIVLKVLHRWWLFEIIQDTGCCSTKIFTWAYCWLETV